MHDLPATTASNRGMLLTAVLAGLLTILPGCASEPRGPCSTSGAIGTVCGFENPEDIEYIPAANVILVTNMRLPGRGPDGATTGGFISVLDVGTGQVSKARPEGAGGGHDPAVGDPVCTMPPRAGTFHPHGLTARREGDRTFIYVVGHEPPDDGREAIEIFEVSGRGPATRVTWRGCIPVEPGVTGNDVSVAPDGEVIMSNYQPSASLWHTIKANGLGLSTGDIRTWKRGRGWASVPGTAARQPNGVAVSPDGKLLFYSETGTGEVHRVSRASPAARATVDVGGNPDNLAWTPRGTLLVATHTAGAEFLSCAFGRAPCRTSWEIHEIDPDAMTARMIFAGDGDALGAVAAPLVVSNLMYLSSVFDDRIGVVPFPAP